VATARPDATASDPKTTAAPKLPADELEEMADGGPADKSVVADDGDEPATAKDDQPAAGEAADDDDEKSENKPGKVTVQKAFQKATKFLEQQDTKGAITELEKALPDNPKDVDLLFVLAQMTMQAAADKDNPDDELYKKSAGYIRQLLNDNDSLRENSNVLRIALSAYFKEACILAKEDKAAEALKVLQEATDLGFRYFAQLEKNSDLEPVRALPEYADYLENSRKILEKEREEQSQAVDELFANTEPFEFTFELTDIEGEAIATADLKGKVAIIDVWGTWCPPCRAEIPHFVELQTKYKDAGFEIVGLNQERAEGDAAVDLVKGFHKENNMNYRCALADEETVNKIPVTAFPTTLFVDRTGKVRVKAVGYHDFVTLYAIVSRLVEEKADGDKPATEDKSDKEAKSE
jgi:thiol-disulfide isomerase/thioredoxin